MPTQLSIPFGISPGCEPYFSEFLHEQKETCKGGLVFPIGEKSDCRDCARTCSGCIEMAINMGFSKFTDVKHLIQNPQMLIGKYWNMWIEWKKTEQGK